MEDKDYKILDCDKYLSYNQLRKAIITNTNTIKLLETEVKKTEKTKW